jgi:hypothetical protein
MVAEILAGIALVKSASEAISNCKDVSQIAGHLNQLLTGAEQVKKKQKNSVAQKWGSVLQKKLNDDDGDDTSISVIAQEKIDAALAEEALLLARQQIIHRFGPDIWHEILIERDERIEKNKSAAARKKEEDKIFWDKVYTIMRNVLILFAAAGAVGSYIISRIK